MDAASRAKALKEAYYQPLSNFSQGLFETKTDFLDPLIIFVVSRFSDWHGALFAVYGLIFGYFSIKYISNLISYSNIKSFNTNIILFLWMLVWVNSVFEIGGFRMWSGAWIFSYAALQYLFKKEFKYIGFSSIALMMHFSYFPLVLLLCLYHFLGNRIYFYSLMAIATFFVSELDPGVLKSYASLVNAAVEKKVEDYTNESYIESVNENRQNLAWFMKFSRVGVLYFVVGLLFWVVKNRIKFKYDEFLLSTLSFSLLLLSFSNLSSLFPAGGRFRVHFYIFAFSSFIFYFSKYRYHRFFKWNYIGLPALLISNLIVLRYGSEMFNAYLLGPSFGFFLMVQDTLSLSDILFK